MIEESCAMSSDSALLSESGPNNAVTTITESHMTSESTLAKESS